MKTATKRPVRKSAKKPTPRKVSTRPAAKLRTVSKKTSLRGGHLVVDGTNVICGAQDRTRFDLLLSLVVAAAADGTDVLCIFDATTPHRLGTSPERDLYRWLLTEKARHFVQCPGRTEADLLILAEAERMHCPVVSNDFFRDREERYPWVRDKGRVLRHQPIRDVLYLGDRALPVESDFGELRRQVEQLFA